MAGKRRATSELNRDNWDDEEPAEESGLYRKASEDVLKKRVFKTAKRRITKPTEEGSMSAFNSASLANLTSKSNQPATQLFSFLSDIKTDDSKSNGISNKPSNPEDGKKESNSLFSFGSKTDKLETNPSFENKTTDQKKSSMFSFGDNKLNNEPSSSMKFSDGNNVNSLMNHGNKNEGITEKKKSGNTEEYYAKLKGLNESVSKWIHKHVESNPLINLQPIFRDYEKFFDEIDKEYQKSDSIKSKEIDRLQETDKTLKSSESPSLKNTFSFGTTSVDKSSSLPKIETSSMFQFGNNSSVCSTNSNKNIGSTNPSSTFKFGNTADANNLNTNKTDQFSFKVETSPPSNVPNNDTPLKFNVGSNSSGFGGFNFTSNSVTQSPTNKINFGAVPSSVPKINEEDEESEEPPKVEVKEVEEEGQIYSIKCKLFVKKDGNYVEKGIGNLILKPVPESDKIQVIIRAHNSLANVLCNFILSKSIPTQRMGKNNVMIVCIPTPESKPPPIPVLIKVKSGEDADQLLETLEKYKK